MAPMEPQIQYTQTTDGVNIAYWSIGDGIPLIILPVASFSHVQLEWQMAEYRRWYEALISRGCNVIRYDQRGCGLSDRSVEDFSMEAQMRDLEAVVDAIGHEKYTIWAPIITAPLGIHYAATRPDRVSHLIIWCGFARYEDWMSSPVVQGMMAILDKDWELYTETVSHAALGWTETEPARQYAAYMRECVSHEGAKATFAALESADVESELSDIQCPTLVLHRRKAAFPPVELSRALAAQIPKARFALFEGTSLASYIGDIEAESDSIAAFLRPEEAGGLERSDSGSVRTILFTDIEGSTEMTQRLGDAQARDVMREHERITREQLKAHGGAEIKTMGDGFMASFGSATRAVECAVALQKAIDESNRQTDLDGLSIRVGLNIGEPIEEESDLFGTAVILAARVAARANGGEVLVTDAVRQIVAGKGFSFLDRGEFEPKGFDEPVRVYEVAWA
jgi:class 3 adenylate cyclase/alpha-beta hydrolase superfamily lysophospholipase